LVDFKEAFSLFDTDADGYVTAQEVGVAIRAVAGPLTEAEVQQVVQDVNDNSQSRYSFSFIIMLFLHLF
jgi:calmodulin